jgi:hypothetical protein
VVGLVVGLVVGQPSSFQTGEVAMFRGLVFLCLIACASNASAAGDVAMVRAYNGITVTLSPQAANCSVRDEEAFRSHLKNSFDEIGLPMDADQPVHAHLVVTAQSVGSLDGKCLIAVSLAFNIPLKAESITLSEGVSHRETVFAILKDIEEVPVLLFADGEFGADYPMNAQSQALYLVDQLVERFAAQRKRN